MTPTNKSYLLIENILHLIERYGVDNAIEKLKLVNVENNDNEIIIAFITTSICNHFRIDKEELLLGSSRKDNVRIQGLSILCYLLYTHISMSQNDIAVLIGKDKTRVCRYINTIKSLNPKILHDKEFMENKFRIENKVKQYISDNYENGTKGN